MKYEKLHIVNLKRGISLIFFALLIYGTTYKAAAQCATCREGHNDFHDPAVSALTPNGSGSLGLSYIQQNVCGLNYVTASVETTTRATWQPGTGFPTHMVVSTLPASCIKIQKAFLYWGVSYTEASAPSVTTTIINPLSNSNTYTSTVAGTASQVCWGEVGTAGYRADVTSSISGNGTYTISLTGFNNASYEVDGMTLVIIYTSPSSYSGSIALWDGCISTFTGTPLTQTLTGFNVCDNTATASGFGAYGDMQNNISASNSENYNGSTGTFPNNFWNTDIVNTSVSAGQTSATYKSYTNNTNDCFLWILAGLYWQNTTCLACSVSPISLTTGQINPNCGNKIGSAWVNVSGGASPYNFSWSNGQTTDTATGLGTGTYTVKVKDAFCDSATATVTLLPASPPVKDSAFVISNVKCNGESNGVAGVTVSSGTSPFSYAWSPIGGTNTTANNLSAGTYTATVTDSVGCKGTAAVTIGQPKVVRDSITSTTGVSCNGGNNGSASLGVSGGTTPYHYSWSNGETSATALNLTAGTYTVSVLDSNGCNSAARITITQPAPLKATIGPVTNPGCNGGTNGSATVTASNGMAPYTYSWAPNGATTSTATGLSAGYYSITVTDSNGCTTNTSVTLIETKPISTVNTVNNLICNGASNGSVTVSASGGSSPFNYSWSSGATTSSINNLTAGTYILTITDSNSCIKHDTANVTQPSPIIISIDSMTMPSCYGSSDGSITISASGGTPFYIYNWSPSGGTNTTANNLTAGTYVVTTEDNEGCIKNDTIKLTQPARIKPKISGKDSICMGDSATLTASGGTTYLWQPGSNTNSSVKVSPASATTYTLTATTGACSADTTFSVYVNPKLKPGLSAKDTVCSGDSTQLIASGGTAYIWSNGKTSNNIWVKPLSTSTYSVQVSKGSCTADTSVTITVIPPLTPAINAAKDSICPGTNVLITASGGTTYKWSTGSTSASIMVSPKTTTTYSVITYSPCGSDTLKKTINIIPAAISISGNISVCKGQSTTISVTGGIAYNWSTGATTASISVTDTVKTTYTVQVSNGKCTYDTSVTINILSGPAITITNPAKICPGDSVILTATGGGTYLWSTGATSSSILVNPITSTVYSVTVTNGCPATANTSVTIDVPTINACCDTTIKSGESANLQASGGSNYSWAPPDGLSCTICPDPTATPTVTTTYTVTGIDNNGCIANSRITVEINPCEDFAVPNIFTPNGDGTNDLLAISIKAVDAYSLSIFDRWGTLIFNTNTTTDYWDGKTKNGSNAPDGVYYYIIKATCGNDNYDKQGFIQVLR
jgi:gliding motility-associated-like protein